jgi:UPF0755 protein
MKLNNSNFGLRVGSFLLVLMVIVFGGYLWWSDAVSPVDPSSTTGIEFTVNPGEGVKQISTRLYEERLVRSSTGFFLIVKFLNLEKNLQAGDFRLYRTMNAATVAEALTHGMSDVWLTVPEGWRVEEVATEVAKTFGIPEKEFIAVSREGYMFPDTYRLSRDATAAAVAAVFTKTFDEKIPLSMRTSLPEGLTFDQVVTLASLVEKEGKTNTDRPVIAGILLNRLRIDMPLQVDATLQYSLGYQVNEKTWWKKELSDDDKKIDSPYNTYTNTGLPPGPIANPGVSSIQAVLHPTKSEYLYYIHDKTGAPHFGKTLVEHEANVAKYLR